MKAHIIEDMKAALRAQDKPRLGAIRLILAAIKQKEIDERIVLTDPQVVSILESMQKQRRESIAEFGKAQRQDLVDKEQFELSVIQQYMPEPLAAEALEAIIKQTIIAVKATSAKEMGAVMAALKPKIHGRADMAAVSGRVRALLL